MTLTMQGLVLSVILAGYGVWARTSWRHEDRSRDALLSSAGILALTVLGVLAG